MGSPIQQQRKFGLDTVVRKTITMTGGAAAGLAGSAIPLFTVTGDVDLDISASIGTSLVGAATLEVGVSGNTAALLPQVADASTLTTTNNLYVDNTAGTVKTSGTRKRISGKNIIATVGGTNITAGVITFFVRYRALSADGAVV